MNFLQAGKKLNQDIGEVFPPASTNHCLSYRSRRQKAPHNCGHILQTLSCPSLSEVQWDSISKTLLCEWCLLVSKSLGGERAARKQWAEEGEKMQVAC